MFKKKVNTAKICNFPKCENCEHYRKIGEINYCDVPMVISKQQWLLLGSAITRLSKRLDEIEKAVDDEILGV